MAIIKNPLTLVKQEGGGGQTTGEYFARVVDYDGTVLAMEYLNDGDEFILPDFPEKADMTYERWVGSQAISSRVVNDKTEYYIVIDGLDFIAAPLAHTTDGAMKIGIKLDLITDLTICIKFISIQNTRIIDWGDGNIEAATAKKVSHTYLNYGEYEISIKNQANLDNDAFCTGLTTSTAIDTPWAGQTNQELFLGNKKRARLITYVKSGDDNCDVWRECCLFQLFLKYIAVSSHSITRYTSYSGFAFNLEMGSLNGGFEVNIIPYFSNSTGTINAHSSSTNALLGKNVIIENGWTAMAEEMSFQNAEYFVIPKSVNAITGNYVLQVFNYKPDTLRLYAETISAIRGIKCKKMYFGDTVKTLTLNNIVAEDIRLPNNYTTINASQYSSNITYTIPKINDGRLIFPQTLTTISRQIGNLSNFDYVEFPTNITQTISGMFLGSINRVKFKGLTNIVASSFNSVPRMVLDLTECQSIPTLANINAFYSLATNFNGNYPTYQVFILVPRALYDQWIIETNWVSLAPLIIPVDPS